MLLLLIQIEVTMNRRVLKLWRWKLNSMRIIRTNTDLHVDKYQNPKSYSIKYQIYWLIDPIKRDCHMEYKWKCFKWKNRQSSFVFDSIHTPLCKQLEFCSKDNILWFQVNSVKVYEMDEIVEKIRARIANVDPNGPRKVTGVFQLNVKSNDGSTRAITLDLNKLEVLDDNVRQSPDVSVDFDTNALAQVATNEISFIDAITSGMVKLSGNLELARHLGNVVCNKPIE